MRYEKINTDRVNLKGRDASEVGVLLYEMLSDYPEIQKRIAKAFKIAGVVPRR
jgi:hypothetical protein